MTSTAPVISKQTSITLGLVFAILAIVVGIAWKGGVWAERMERSQTEAGKDIDELKVEVSAIRRDISAGESWDIDDAENFHNTLQALNPDIVIPRIHGAR